MLEVSVCNTCFYLKSFSWKPAYRDTSCRKLSLIGTLPAEQGPFHECSLHAENVQSWVALKGQKTAQDLLGHHPLAHAALEMLTVQVCSSEQYSWADELD